MRHDANVVAAPQEHSSSYEVVQGRRRRMRAPMFINQPPRFRYDEAPLGALYDPKMRERHDQSLAGLALILVWNPLQVIWGVPTAPHDPNPVLRDQSVPSDGVVRIFGEVSGEFPLPIPNATGIFTGHAVLQQAQHQLFCRPLPGLGAPSDLLLEGLVITQQPEA